MSTVSLTLDEIFDLAKKTLLANGCDDETASILSDLIRMRKETDLCLMDCSDYQHM